MDAAGAFVVSHPHIALVPILFYTLILPVVAWYAAANVYLYSMGTPKYVPKEMFAYNEET